MLSDSVIVNDGDDAVSINDVTEIISPVISEYVVQGEANRDNVQVVVNNDALSISEIEQSVNVSENLTVQPVITEGIIVQVVKEPNSFITYVPALADSIIESISVNNYSAVKWELSVLDEISFKIKYFTISARLHDLSCFFVISHIFGDNFPTPCVVEIISSEAVLKLNNNRNNSLKIMGVRSLINK